MVLAPAMSIGPATTSHLLLAVALATIVEGGSGSGSRNTSVVHPPWDFALARTGHVCTDASLAHNGTNGKVSGVGLFPLIIASVSWVAMADCMLNSL